MSTQYQLDLDAACNSIKHMNSSPSMLASDSILCQIYGPLEDLRLIGKVAERVTVLDALWGTRLFMEAGVGDKIALNIRHNADMLIDVMKALKENDLENAPDCIIVAARKVMPAILDHSPNDSKKYRKNYSFATKFFHWCTRRHFPIVDSRARKRINNLQIEHQISPRIPKEMVETKYFTCIQEYERWIRFYSDLIVSISFREREMLCRCDFDSQPCTSRVVNSLLRILDKVFYVQGGGAGMSRIAT